MSPDSLTSGSCSISIGKTMIVLLPHKAVWVPDMELLLIADSHLGKDASFRSGGVPVPSDSTQATLDRLHKVIELAQPKQLVILGDMFHDQRSVSSTVYEAVRVFLDRNTHLRIQLIIGNHDRSVGKLPAEWGIECIEPTAMKGRLALAHEPVSLDETSDGVDIILCGHVHPGVRLRAADERLRPLPCFWQTGQNLVLPAFGDFTGYHLVSPNDHRTWVVAEGEVLPLS